MSASASTPRRRWGQSVRWAVAGLAAALAGCFTGFPMPEPIAPPCLSDDECGPGQVCFVDGCGDPGEGLVFEVAGNTAAGQYAQDFPLGDGGLSTGFDFVLETPLWLGGTLQVEVLDGGAPLGRAPYSGDVLVRAVGESELLPGLARSFESRFGPMQLTEGRFEMPLGPGRFTVSATAAEVSVPPVFRDGIIVRGSVDAPSLELTFPAPSPASTFHGRLLRRSADGGSSVELALGAPAYDVQAFDPTSRRALSQRTPVGSGGASEQGSFSLALHPSAAALERIEVVASPRQARALAPTKSFTVDRPFPASSALELGDFGQPLVGVRGRVLDARGAAVAGAAVVAEGVVPGGGLFRSTTALTELDGAFSLDLLPAEADEGHLFTVLPPPESRAARTAVRVPVLGPDGLAAARLARDVLCAERSAVRGQLFALDGAPAHPVTVRAVPRGSETAPSTSSAVAETATLSDGRFELWIDPGDYRLDFVVSASGARASRALRVVAPAGPSGGDSAVDLGALTLPRWRRLAGLVRVQSAVRALTAVPFAVVRAFRLDNGGDRPSAVLVGQAVADERGDYELLLPTR